MNTVDLTLFDNEDGLEIKTPNKTYLLNSVFAIHELKLMQKQEEIANKLSKWKTLENNDLLSWKDLIKTLIKDQGTQELDEGDINKLSAIQVVAIMYGILDYLKQRTQLVFESLSPETKNEAKKLEEEVKKKTLQELAS